MENEELDSGKNKIIHDGTSIPTQNNTKEKLVGKIFPKLNNFFENVAFRSKKNNKRSLLTKSQIIRLEPTAPVAEKKRIIDQEMFGYEDPYLEPNTKMDY